LVFLFSGFELGKNMKDLVEREGLFYKKFTDVPFTGEEQKEFENGEKDDPQVSYHDNGQLLEKGTRKNGKKDGPWVRYYDNGKLSFKGTYKEGKRDGPWVSHNKDGTVNPKFTGTYKDSKKVK
jgi:antitoxin component YwqK of YwqJK toxin-antitoxin module